MRTLHFSACTLGVLVAIWALSLAPLQADLVQQLRFEGDLTDSVGTYDMGSPGTGIGYPSESTNGNHWEGLSAVAFDETQGGRGWIAADATLNGNDFTVMFWLAPHQAHPAYTSYLMAASNFAFAATFSPPDGDRIWIDQWQGGTNNRTDTGYAPPRGAWTHLAFVYEAGSQTLSLYANGRLKFQQVLPLPAGLSGSSYHHVASDAWGTAGTIYKGRMDDYRMYNEALSQTAIEEIVAPGGLVQHLEFEGWRDSLYAQDLGHNTSATLVAEGRVGTGTLQFVDSGGWAYFERKWDELAAPEFTQAYWLRIPAGASNTGAARITAMSNFAFETSLFNGANVALYNDDNGTSGWLQTPLAPLADEWNHLAWSYDGTTMTLIVNGEAVWSAALAVAIDRSNDLWTLLGADKAGIDNINAQMDDYRMYNRALSAQEVANLYPPDPASDPSPGDLAVDVGVDPALSWTAGDFATTHVLYLSDTTPLQPSDVVATMTATTFSPATLSTATTYHWRVDSLNEAGLTQGPEWSFTTVAYVPPTDLLLHLTFDGDLLDRSLYGNDATAFGDAITTDAAREGSGCLLLDGSGDYALVPADPSMDAGSFTMMAWVNPDNSGGPTPRRIWAHEDYVFEVAVRGAKTLYYPEQPAPGVFVWSGNHDTVNGQWDLHPDGNWSHVAYVVDTSGSSDTLTVYVNGRLAGSRDSVAGTFSRAGKALYIGSAWPSGEEMAGRIDDLRLYGRAMTATEIAGLYAPTAATDPEPADLASEIGIRPYLSWTPGDFATTQVLYLSQSSPLQASDAVATLTESRFLTDALSTATSYFWRVDSIGESGSVTGSEWTFSTVNEVPPADLLLHLAFEGNLLDSSRYGNHPTALGDAATGTNLPAEGSGCLVLDGVGDYLTVPHDVSLDASDFTVMAWVNAEETSVTWLQRAWAYENYAFDVALQHEMTLYFPQQPTSGTFTWSGYLGNLPDGDWSHVAYVVETSASGDLATVYVNGRTVGSHASEPGTLSRQGLDLFVGADQLGSNNLAGKMDDLRIYGRALTANEIDELADIPVPTSVNGRQWMLYE